jgi:hypothetical protein
MGNKEKAQALVPNSGVATRDVHSRYEKLPCISVSAGLRRSLVNLASIRAQTSARRLSEPASYTRPRHPGA